MIRLAIVSPCYNEEEVLETSVNRLTQLYQQLIKEQKITEDSFFLFVNDGSKDKTWDIICRLHKENKFVHGVNLAHNVGHQNAIMAGMMTAKDRADAAITIDADLQDDLKAIPQMIDDYAKGYDIIYGVKVSRTADPLMKRLSAQAFYKLQSKMGVNSIYNHADFRFMSRHALEMLSRYKEKKPLSARHHPYHRSEHHYRGRCYQRAHSRRIQVHPQQDAQPCPRWHHLILCEANLWHHLSGHALHPYLPCHRSLRDPCPRNRHSRTWLGLCHTEHLAYRWSEPHFHRHRGCIYRQDI